MRQATDTLEQCIQHLQRRSLLTATKAQALVEAISKMADFQWVTERAYMERASLEFTETTGRIKSLRATRILLEEEKIEAARKSAQSARDVAAQRSRAEPSKTQPATVASVSPAPVPGPAGTAPEEAMSHSKSTAIQRFEEIRKLMGPILLACDKLEREGGREIKDLKLKYRMNINRRIGQIANSREQIINITQDLLVVLNKAYSVGHEFWCFALITVAKKLIEQAETQICLHVPSAFPVAQVVVDLSTRQKYLLPAVLYFIMCRAPLAIPRHIPRRQGQSEQEHKLAMGYLQMAGSLEGEQAYAERMSGLLSLLAAIVQARPSLGEPAAYGIENGWVWLASFLNLPPQPISPYILCAFLEVAGYAMWRRYQQHFNGLMDFIRRQYLPLIPATSVAGKTRLELFLGPLFKKSRPKLEPPEGSVLLP